MSKTLLESLLPVSENITNKLQEHTIFYEDHNREMLAPNNDSLYAALIPVPSILDEVNWWVGQNELVDKVIEVGGKFYDKVDYHTTLVYSKTAGSTLYEYLRDHSGIILESAEATFKDLAMFGTCCVMLLDAPYLQTLNKKLTSIGATSDFPDYNPHITLFKLPDTISEDDKQWFKDWMDGQRLPTSTITYDNLNCAPLDETWGD